jgi:mRNA interferase MazF
VLEQNLYNLNEKFNVFMNIEQADKERFKEIIAWAGEMMEMTVKEKYSRSIQPMRCEVWTCQFGQNVGSEVNKVRPALIISDDLGNCKSPTVTVIPITSREARQVTHVEISESDLAYVENVIKGTITAEGVRNVSKARLGRRIGKVNNTCMAKVEDALMKALGFVPTESHAEEQELSSILR